MIINEIWKGVQKYQLDNWKGNTFRSMSSLPAMQIRLHPSVFHECMSCDYTLVISAFPDMKLSNNRYPERMFHYDLLIDPTLSEGKWEIGTPKFLPPSKLNSVF